MKEVVVDVEGKIWAFDMSIAMSDRFDIAGSVIEDDIEFFAVRDNKFPEDSEESHVYVPVTEVCDKPLKQILACLEGDRKAVVCEGVTRIVGYYSRTGNWNKSKIGELRDRQNGNYGTPNYEKQYKEESMAVCNNL